MRRRARYHNTAHFVVTLAVAGLIPACSGDDDTSSGGGSPQPASCGDGVVDEQEVCDDGNTTAGDGCSSDCLSDETCGNGTTDWAAGETCDDGESNSDSTPDACRTTCTKPACGDGVADTGEACDDGPYNSNVAPDACRTDCSLPVCGDDVVDSGEACDDGLSNSDTATDACRTDCSSAACGDGVVDTGEACDDGSQNSDTAADACRTDCTTPRCGDGAVDTGEACDDGSQNSDTATDACRTDCTGARCGDGVIDTGETCDDGPANDDTAPDACRTSCLPAHCGDTVQDAGEQCDDGNTIDGDGCDSACALEPDLVVTKVWEVGTEGTGDGQFDNAADVAVDSQGNIYVCDYLNDRVQKLDPDGNYLLQWAHDSARDIEIDENDHVYVWGQWMMRKYDTSGTEIAAFKRLNHSTQLNGDNHFAVSKVDDELAILNISASVQNTNPMQTIVTDVEQHHVVRTTKSTASFVGLFGLLGNGPGEFQRPFTAEYGPSGKLYILDPDTDRLQIFEGGSFVEELPLNIDASFGTIFVLDHAGRILVRTGSTTVTAYSADGLVELPFTIDATPYTYTLARYLETWYDSASGTEYLVTTGGTSVCKYELSFVAW